MLPTVATHGGHAILDPQLVLPPAPHVVYVANLRVPAKPEIRKGNVHWLAVQTWPGVHGASDAELKEVDRFPFHRHLKHAVKFVQRHGVRHENAPPDHGADPKQPDLQLQKNRSRLGRCPGIRHATRLQEALHDASSRLTPETLVVPLVAAMRMARPDVTLKEMCDMLEEMREPTPRGRATWYPSSVKALLERAERLALASQGTDARRWVISDPMRHHSLN